MLTECRDPLSFPPACVACTTTLACEEARCGLLHHVALPAARRPLSSLPRRRRRRPISSGITTTTLLASGRKETLTPPRFGVRTKVSLRADGFVPVLHLQGDVAIAVNALSGMQGVHARSPIPSSCTPLPRTHVFSGVCAARVSRGTRPDDYYSALSLGSFRLSL